MIGPRADLGPADTGPGEGRALIRDLDRRAFPVLALLERRVWPYDELGTLTAFLRDTVLRPATAGYGRLLALTAQLERVRGEPCAPERVRGLVDEVSAALRDQLLDEQRELADLPWPPIITSARSA